jgi:hypothetical protein
MLFIGLMPLIVIPAALVMLLGLWAMPRLARDDQDSRWPLFLTLTAIVLLIPIALNARHLRAGQVGLFLLLLFPALEGVLALMLVGAGSLYAQWQKAKVLFSALFLALVLLLAAIALGEAFLLLAITIPPLILALLWTAGRRVNAAGLVVLSVVVFVWLLLDALGVSASRWLIPATSSRGVHTIVRLVGVALACALISLLIYRSAESPWAISRRRVPWHLLLATFLVLGLVATVAHSGVLINATSRAAEDHLPFAEVLVAIIVGMVLTGALEKRRGFAGPLFVILAPVLIAGAYALGWLFDPQAITQHRADRLTRAIERYQRDVEAYPPSLAALTPGYLPLILRPITGRDQVWCYQGGGDYYRLGYVFYLRYYGPTLPDPYYGIKTHSSAGQPPDGPWVCDDELKRVEVTAGL